MADGARVDLRQAFQAVVRSPITELVWFNGLREAAGTSDVWHLHPFHQLDVVLEGAFEHVIEGHPMWVSRSREAVLVPPLLRHYTRTRSDCSHASYKVNITGEIADTLGQRAFRFRLSSALFEVIRDATQCWIDSKPFAAERVIAAGSLIILAAIERVPRAQPLAVKNRAFRRRLLSLLVELELRPDAHWTVAEMARKCSLSAEHFSRLFRREVGENPKRFLLGAGMRHAAGMLTEAPGYSIKQISELAGYGTVQAFTRAFRHAFGTTPAAFRQEPRAGCGPSRLISLKG